MSTSLFTQPTDFRKLLSANRTASAFTARTDLTAMPAATGEGEGTTGYIYVSDSNTVLIKPYGTDADGETGSLRVYGVRPIVSGGRVQSVTHVLLGEYGFTLSSTLTGVAGGVVGASEFYADTISQTYGLENVADQVFTPTGDEPAHILVDRKGHDVLLVDLIVGTAASVNALIAGV